MKQLSNSPNVAAPTSSGAATPPGRDDGAAPGPQPGAASSWSNAQLAACAHREVRYRQRVYPRLIEQGRMNATIANKEIAQMQAIAAHFEQLRRADCPSLL